MLLKHHRGSHVFSRHIQIIHIFKNVNQNNKHIMWNPWHHSNKYVLRNGLLICEIWIWSIKTVLFWSSYRITITTQGKYKAIAAQAIPKLVILVNDENSEVRLNAIKAITMLSEAPEGRRALLNHEDMVSLIRYSPTLFQPIKNDSEVSYLLSQTQL